MRVEYYDAGGKALLHLRWERLEAFSGWRGEYYANRDLEGPPAFVRDDADIAFDWGGGRPGPLMPKDDFSVRWTRSVELPAGRYRFWASADDGVRYLVNDERVIDEWHGSPGTYYKTDRDLEAGRCDLTVEYYEHGVSARVNAGWEGVSEAEATRAAESYPLKP